MSKQLSALRVRLKSGEYDGADIMQAWVAIDELIEVRKELDSIPTKIRVMANLFPNKLKELLKKLNT